MKTTIKYTLMATALSLLIACGGGGGGGGGSNIPPIANAGTQQSVLTGATVTLDGSGSSDADGNALTYVWTLTSKPVGSSSVLSLSTAIRPTFIADVVGTYVASLIVNDGKVNSTASTVTVTVDVPNYMPVANAGFAKNVLTGATVTLDGSGSSDADGNALTYVWTLTSKPVGSSSVLSLPTAIRPTFIADVVGTYVASLIVNDGKVNSTASTVTVNAAVYDTSGPTVSAITIDKPIVDVSSSSQVVVATIKVADATGIDLTRLPSPYWFKTTQIAGTRIDSTWVKISGDSKLATFTSTVTIPAYSATGDWLVGCTAFYDTLGYSSTNGGYELIFQVR